MESRLLRRPALELLTGKFQCLLSLNATSRRHESSYRRTKARLNIKPDSSFLLTLDSPKQDHIVFNPPASAPSVLHTPIKFLPKTDKRRQLLATTVSRLDNTPVILPPRLREQTIPHHHLSENDVAEMRRLRLLDPVEWSTGKLARKYNCSTLFVTTVVQAIGKGEADARRKQVVKERWAETKSKWGPRKIKAKSDAERRFVLARRGE